MLHIRQLQISQIKSDIDHEVVVKRKDGTYAKGHLKYVGIPTGMKETGTIMAGITLDLPSKKLSTYIHGILHALACASEYGSYDFVELEHVLLLSYLCLGAHVLC